MLPIVTGNQPFVWMHVELSLHKICNMRLPRATKLHVSVIRLRPLDQKLSSSLLKPRRSRRIRHLRRRHPITPRVKPTLEILILPSHKPIRTNQRVPPSSPLRLTLCSTPDIHTANFCSKSTQSGKYRANGCQKCSSRRTFQIG